MRRFGVPVAMPCTIVLLILSAERDGADAEFSAGFNRNRLLREPRAVDEGTIERTKVAEHHDAVGFVDFAVMPTDERMLQLHIGAAAAANDGGELKLKMIGWPFAHHHDKYCLHTQLHKHDRDPWSRLECPSRNSPGTAHRALSGGPMSTLLL